MKRCFPLGIRCIWARSAGGVIGILRRDKVDGILLDFDLYQSPHGDPHITGESVLHVRDPIQVVPNFCSLSERIRRQSHMQGLILFPNLRSSCSNAYSRIALQISIAGSSLRLRITRSIY
jgi:hypothetical protein